MAPDARDGGAVVAGLGAGWVWQQSRPRPSEDLLALASAQGEVRQTFGRLSEFGWAAPPAVTRSGAVPPAGTAPATLLDLAAEIDARARSRAAPEARHARGVALLVAGEVDAAIVELSAALDARPDDIRLINDAAVAYLQRAWSTSDGASAGEARRLAERVVALQPSSVEGWFNLLMAARLTDDEALATRAAREVIAREAPSSGWRKEAEER